VRALTVLQPWASCIAYFGKRVENRTWRPPESMLGQRIAIHAGVGLDKSGWDAFWTNRDLVGPNTCISFAMGLMLASPKAGRGVILATAVIERITTEGDSPWFTGPFGWVLREVETLEPDDWVKCRGAQGLWTLPADVESAVLAARKHRGRA